MLSNIETTTCTPSYYDALTVLLASLAPTIERAALALARRVYSIPLDVDDLVQEANAAIIKASSSFQPMDPTNTRAIHGWYMKRARGEMFNYARAQIDRQARSIEDWQEVETKDGTMHRELPATETPARLANLGERRRILAALRKLPDTQRLVLLAAYGIEDERGRVYSPGDVCTRLGITASGYRCFKSRAIKRLATILS